MVLLSCIAITNKHDCYNGFNYFSVYTTSPWIVASMQSSMMQDFFTLLFWTHRFYRHLSDERSHQFLWPICLSSPLVHFRKCTEYLTVDIVQVFINLNRFLLQSSVSWNLVILMNFFFTFSFIPVFLMASVFSNTRYLNFFSDWSVLFLLLFPFFFFWS